MAERIRTFKGATELNVSGLTITQTNDILTDAAAFEMVADSDVAVGGTIDFKKNDGTTTIFSGVVVSISKGMFWKVKVRNKAWELTNLRVEGVYTSTTPEAIVQDVIDNTSQNLTYASSGSSGITINKYIARSYGIDVIQDMMDVLDWQIRVDVNDNFYFEPKGNVDNSLTLTNGTNFNITKWERDNSKMFNRVRVIGGFEIYQTSETATVGSATSFDLTRKPTGTFRITIAEVEVDPETYTVEAEEKLVTFANATAVSAFDYSFNLPIIIDNQDDDSINTYGEIFQEVPAPWLNDMGEARVYSQKLLDVFSTPQVKAGGYRSSFDFTRVAGEVVTVVDAERSESELLVINKIVHDNQRGTTILEFGGKDFLLYDWQRDVQERVKKLERRFINTDTETFARALKSTMRVNLSSVTAWMQNSPVNSFMLNHPTLGRLRTDLNTEPDCSATGTAFGTWNGTGIAGSQYVTTAYRLGGGDFNGSDNYVSIANAISGVQTVSFYINADSLNQSILQISGTGNITVDASGDIQTSGLANETVYINGVAGTRIVAGTWALVTVTFDAHTANDIELGREGSNYYTGELDEVMFFDNQISTASMASIVAKDFYDDTMGFTIAGLLSYWALDNNRLGDRSTTKVTAV